MTILSWQVWPRCTLSLGSQGLVTLTANQLSVRSSHCGVWTCGNNKFACTLPGCPLKNFTVPVATILQNAALLSDIGSVPSTTTVTAPASTNSDPTDFATSETASATNQCEAALVTSQCETASGVSTGGAVGIGIGIGAPLALASAVLFTLLLREKRRQRVYEARVESNFGTDKEQVSVPTVAGSGSVVRSELMGGYPHELAT